MGKNEAAHDGSHVRRGEPIGPWSNASMGGAPSLTSAPLGSDAAQICGFLEAGEKFSHHSGENGGQSAQLRGRGVIDDWRDDKQQQRTHMLAAGNDQDGALGLRWDANDGEACDALGAIAQHRCPAHACPSSVASSDIETPNLEDRMQSQAQALMQACRGSKP